MIEKPSEQEKMAENQLDNESLAAKKEHTAETADHSTAITEDKQQTREKEKKKARTRLIPIWLRLLIVAALLVGSVMFGLVVGYAIIGDGHVMDVFNKSTWTHIVDLVTKQ